MVRLILVLLMLGGCSVDSDINTVSFYSNGEFVGTSNNYNDDLALIYFDGVTYETDYESIFVNDVEFVYSDNLCETPYVMKGKVFEGGIVGFDGYDVHYITWFSYKSFNNLFKSINGQCELTDFKGGHVSKVRKRERFQFVDQNMKFIYKPMPE